VSREIREIESEYWQALLSPISPPTFGPPEFLGRSRPWDIRGLYRVVVKLKQCHIAKDKDPAIATPLRASCVVRLHAFGMTASGNAW
jgi:hypothetical protein